MPYQSLDPDNPLPLRLTAATHAYWLMPGAVSLGSAPQYDRLVGTVALGPAPDRDFYEQVELYNPTLRYEYLRAEEVEREQQRRYVARPFIAYISYLPLFAQSTLIPAGFFACSVAFALLWWLQPSYKTLGPVIFCALLTIASLIVRARWFPALKPHERGVIMPQGDHPLDLPAQIRARITPSAEMLAREVPLLNCQVCRVAQLTYDPARGMTACPNCGTVLPIYLWPIEVPAPDEPLLGIS